MPIDAGGGRRVPVPSRRRVRRKAASPVDAALSAAINAARQTVQTSAPHRSTFTQPVASNLGGIHTAQRQAAKRVVKATRRLPNPPRHEAHLRAALALLHPSRPVTPEFVNALRHPGITRAIRNLGHPVFPGDVRSAQAYYVRVKAGKVPHVRYTGEHYELRVPVQSLAGITLSHEWVPFHPDFSDPTKNPYGYPGGKIPSDKPKNFGAAAGSFLKRSLGGEKTKHGQVGGFNAPAEAILQQLTRPIHAIAGGVDAAITGHNVPDAIYKGAIENKPYSFQTVLKHLGAPKTVADIAGGAGDVFLDPTTYLTGGLSAEAKLAVEKAVETAAKRGATDAEIKQVAEETAAKFKDANPHRGVVIGMRGRVPGTDLGFNVRGHVPGTARLGRRIAPAGRALHDSKPVQHVGKLVKHDFREKGVSQVEHQAQRQASRELRNARDQAIARGAQAGSQVQKALEQVAFVPAHAADDIASAIERTPYFLDRHAAPFDVEQSVKTIRRRANKQRVRYGKASKKEKVATGVRRAPVEVHGHANGPVFGIARQLQEKMAEDATRAVLREELAAKAAKNPQHIKFDYPGKVTHGRGGSGPRVTTPQGEKISADALAARQARQDIKKYASVDYPGKLPEELRPIALNVEQRMKAIDKAEVAAGLRARPGKAHYLTHMRIEDLPESAGKRLKKTGGRKPKSTNLAANRQRKMPGTLRQQEMRAAEQNQRIVHTTNIPVITALRTQESHLAQAQKAYLEKIAASGHPFKGQFEDLHPENGHVFSLERDRATKQWKLKPHGYPTSEHDWKALLEDYHSGKHKFFILNPKVVDAAQRAEFRHHGVIDAITRRYKTLATIPNPQYHLSNLMGDTLLGWQADTGGKEFAQSAKAMNLLRKREAEKVDPNVILQGQRKGKLRRKGLPTAQDLNFTITARGGRKLDVLHELDLALQHGGIQGGQLAKELGGTGGAVRRAGEYRENFPRFATWLSARKRGLTPEQAAEHVNTAHFDYGDLTPFEQQRLRSIIPFYTFTARNTRRQVGLLATRPGKAGNFEKFREDFNRSQGQDPQGGKALLDYMQQGAALISKHLLFFPKTPIEQGYKLLDPRPDQAFDNFVSLVSPVLKVPLELHFNYSTFFRGPIEQHQGQLVPAPSFVAHLPSFVKDILGVKQMRDKKSGKLVWAWRAKTDFIVRSLPETNFGASQYTPVTTSRGQNKTLSLLSYFTGIKISENDPEKVQLGRAFPKLTQVQDAIYVRRQQVQRRDGTYPANDPILKALKAQQQSLELIIKGLSKKQGYKIPLFRSTHKAGSGGGTSLVPSANSLGLGAKNLLPPPVQ